jgi:prevent-host-death family protein
MKTITIAEAARNLSELVCRVYYRGESILLVKSGRPMVKMTAVRRANAGRHLAALWAAVPHLNRKDAESFGRDIAAARSNLPTLKAKPHEVAAD